MSSKDDTAMYVEAWDIVLPDSAATDLSLMLDAHADEQVEACIARLKKELQLWLPKDRMDQIEDICRAASLTKRKVK